MEKIFRIPIFIFLSSTSTSQFGSVSPSHVYGIWSSVTARLAGNNPARKLATFLPGVIILITLKWPVFCALTSAVHFEGERAANIWDVTSSGLRSLRVLFGNPRARTDFFFFSCGCVCVCECLCVCVCVCVCVYTSIKKTKEGVVKRSICLSTRTRPAFCEEFFD